MAAAAAAAAAPSGRTGNNDAAATTTSRFAAACGALSRYVKAAEAAERTRALFPPPVPVRPLPLMPGADVGLEEPETVAQQLTIVYGGRALVLDDVTADRAADLLRLAAAAAARGGTEQPLSSVADLPVARKASLQRFMEKRKGRVAAARAEPYRRPADQRDRLTLAL